MWTKCHLRKRVRIYWPSNDFQRVTWNILHVHSSTAAHAVWLWWAQRWHTDFTVPSLPRPPILTQGHQPLPQDGHNRAGLQLLKACPAWPWPPSGISHGFLSHPDLGLTLRGLLSAEAAVLHSTICSGSWGLWDRSWLPGQTRGAQSLSILSDQLLTFQLPWLHYFTLSVMLSPISHFAVIKSGCTGSQKENDAFSRISLLKVG